MTRAMIKYQSSVGSGLTEVSSRSVLGRKVARMVRATERQMFQISEFTHNWPFFRAQPPNNSSNYVSHPLWLPFLCSYSLIGWLMMKHGTQGRIQACWLLFSPFYWQNAGLNHMVRPGTYTHSSGLFISACCKKLTLFTLV